MNHIKKILIVWLFAAPIASLAQQAQEFEIKGHLKGINLKKIYISRKVDVYDVLDSATVVNDTYTLRGKTALGSLMSIQTYNAHMDFNGAEFSVFIAPGKYEIWHEGSFGNHKLVPLQEDGYRQLQDGLAAFQPKIDSLSKIAQDRPFSEESKITKEQLNKVYQERYEKYAEFIVKNPSSPAAFYALNIYAMGKDQPDPAKLKQYFNLLPQQVQESFEAQAFKRKLAFNTETIIGNIAPDFTLTDTAGREVRLTDFRGKYVLVDFWASWCHPCREDSPHVLAAYQQFHQKGFEVLSVSMDIKQRKNAWLAAIRDDHVGAWTHVADMKENERLDGLKSTTNPAAFAFGVTGIPQNFLIDPSGKIIARSLRNGDLETTLTSIFK